MADVSTYSRAIRTYISFHFGTIYAGEVRPSTDPAVTAHPVNWEALTDAKMTQKAMHDYK